MRLIYIITIHNIHNFGSVLQSYALQKFLKNNGYQSKIIDYRPAYYNHGRNRVKSFCSKFLYFRSYLLQHNKYEKFIKNNMAITHKRYTTLNELKVLNKREGIFISGGDQLWNSYHPCGKDDAYKLTFISNYPKLAYGTSMGRDSYTKNEIIELVQKIKDFKSIGLRESCSVKQLFNTKLKDIVYHAADPVLLLQKNEYKKFIGKRRIKEPYVLMYLTAKSDLLEQTINYISINKKLKVVHVSGFRKKCICDYFLKSTGPEDLLNLIYFADYVVSASFHATIFSIIFHKQFSTLLPEEGTNARIEDILKYVGLSNRIIHKKKDIISCNSEINFTNSDKKLENLIKKSKAIFLSALKKYSI